MGPPPPPLPLLLDRLAVALFMLLYLTGEMDREEDDEEVDEKEKLLMVPFDFDEPLARKSDKMFLLIISLHPGHLLVGCLLMWLDMHRRQKAPLQFGLPHVRRFFSRWQNTQQYIFWTSPFLLIGLAFLSFVLLFKFVDIGIEGVRVDVEDGEVKLKIFSNVGFVDSFGLLFSVIWCWGEFKRNSFRSSLLILSSLELFPFGLELTSPKLVLFEIKVSLLLRFSA
jgi:hypothetical protein